MPIKLILLFAILCTIDKPAAQNISSYLKEHAIRIDSAEHLNESVYKILTPFQITMLGEIHGTREPSEFAIGLVSLLTNAGDSVQLGLEIPSEQMTQFLSTQTDSSIYSCDFFLHPKFESGRESMAWAGIISNFKGNPRVHIFFYDVNEGEGKPYQRDNLMYLKIKNQFNLHPSWKMVTLSGNAHNTDAEGNSMRSWLRDDKALNLSSKICSLNLVYLEGTCRSNSGNGLEVKRLGHPKTVYDTTLPFTKYLVLLPSKSDYPYSGFYYTKNITAADMVKGNVDITSIKKELSAILDRDQKTRTGKDSANFMNYIDSCNLIQVESLIAKFGWPGKSLVGGKGNNAVFLVIQHADLSTQLKYFPLMQQSVANNESRPSDLALLQDRILMRQGKKQIYGSQVVLNKTGGQEFYPIEDEINVNQRREKMGLQPIEEYANYFGIKYKLPKE